MIHIFKYRFICFIKNKTLLFWTLIFPIALATLFYFAFSNLGSAEQLEVIDVAVIDQGNESFKMAVESLADKDSDNHLINITYTDQKEAEKLMDEGEVSAALVMSENPSILYQKENMNTQILKEVIQGYLRINSTIGNLASENPQAFNEKVVEDVITNKVIIENNESGGGSADMTVQYFYTVIAMTCMYGAFWGLKSINDSQANQSNQAIRLNVAPTHKMKLILIDYLVAFTIICAELAIVFAYLVGVLNIDFGNHLLLVVAISLCAVLMSLAAGIMIGCVSKFKESTNISIVSMGSLFSCFLAGMMASNMPYILDQNLPFIKYINPATLITRSFSILYYYEDISAVYINMAILLAMSLVFIMLAYRVLRRKAYASI